MATQAQLKAATETLERTMRRVRERALPEGVRAAFLTWGIKSVGIMQAKQLSFRSATTLGVVTGRLRRSITFRIEGGEDLNTMRGIFSTDVIYARVHEYGSVAGSPQHIKPRMHFHDTIKEEAAFLIGQVKNKVQVQIWREGFKRRV